MTTPNATYIFGSDPGDPIFVISQGQEGLGPQLLPGASTGGLGRRVWLSGPDAGSGCFFSTDFDALDLWFPESAPVVSNAVLVALSAGGPWESPVGLGGAPWAPRAGVALVALPDASGALLAGGLSFAGGLPSLPTFGDVWRIDASVCALSAANQQICGGPARGAYFPNNLSCACLPGFSGRACDPPALETPTGTQTATSTPTPTSTPTQTPSATPSSSGLPPSASAAGTPSGTVTWTPRAPAAPPQDPGVSAASVAGGIGGGLAGLAAALFVYGRFLGGGPALSALGGRLSAGLSGLTGGGAGGAARGLLNPVGAGGPGAGGSPASSSRLANLSAGAQSYGGTATGGARGGDIWT